MKLKTIKVYGRLRKFLGSSYFEAAVSSPAEAIRFLMCNFPAVEQHMTQQYYKIKMNNNDVPLDYLSMSGKGDIQIIPVATGSLPAVAAIVGGIASTATAVAGTVLTTAATVGSAVVAGVSAVGSAIGTVAAGIAAEYGTTGILGTLTTMAVNTLAIEGVTALLAPTPQPFDNGSGGSSEPDGSLDPQDLSL
jgi:predicted phage tail protein